MVLKNLSIVEVLFLILLLLGTILIYLLIAARIVCLSYIYSTFASFLHNFVYFCVIYLMRIAYIDFQNIKLWIRELGREIDRKRFFVYLTMKYKIHHIKIYIWYLSKNQEFYDELMSYWYIVFFKKTIEIDGKIKWNVDTAIMRHAVQDVYIQNISLCLLVSGDGDFDELIYAWQQKWIQYKVLIPNHKKSSQLLLDATVVSQRQFLHTIQNYIQKN